MVASGGAGPAAPVLVAGDPELELGPGGVVLRSRFGTRAGYVAAGAARALPASDEPPADAEARAARYAAWRWDAFHRGQVAGL